VYADNASGVAYRYLEPIACFAGHRRVKLHEAEATARVESELAETIRWESAHAAASAPGDETKAADAAVVALPKDMAAHAAKAEVLQHEVEHIIPGSFCSSYFRVGAVFRSPSAVDLDGYFSHVNGEVAAHERQSGQGSP
jgi:hypothetical protein